jgi:hypothetical protein
MPNIDTPRYRYIVAPSVDPNRPGVYLQIHGLDPFERVFDDNPPLLSPDHAEALGTALLQAAGQAPATWTPPEQRRPDTIDKAVGLVALAIIAVILVLGVVWLLA